MKGELKESMRPATLALRINSNLMKGELKDLLPKGVLCPLGPQNLMKGELKASSSLRSLILPPSSESHEGRIESIFPKASRAGVTIFLSESHEGRIERVVLLLERELGSP